MSGFAQHFSDIKKVFSLHIKKTIKLFRFLLKSTLKIKTKNKIKQIEDQAMLPAPEVPADDHLLPNLIAVGLL